MRKSETIPFTSALSRGETVAVAIYILLHFWLMPAILENMVIAGRMNVADANFLANAIGFGYMLLVAMKFLRRDFDPLCDRPLYFIKEILLSYGLMYLSNLAMTGILALIVPGENLNNAAIMEMDSMASGKTMAMAVFLAPLVEELMFRGFIFGVMRRYNRVLAYAFSSLAFSLSHVWSYALVDPSYWLYLLPYIPVSIIMCRLYERTNSIWGTVFFHMLVNGVAMNALRMLEGLL